MHLKVLLPSEVLVDEPVSRIVAEAENGSFCLLPRHIDFVAALTPSLLSFTPAAGGEEFVAIDEGILVKCGPQVMVSTRSAVRGSTLGELKRLVEEQFQLQDEREKLTRTAVAKLEANFVRRFIEMEKH